MAETRERRVPRDAREGVEIYKSNLRGGYHWSVTSVGRKITGHEESFEDAVEKVLAIAAAHGVGS